MTGVAEPVAAPPLDAKPTLQVDWLELVAFFSRRGVARLDRLDGALTVQEEEHLTDDAEADAIIDDRRSLIEEEIERRSTQLRYAYPFELSKDGEELRVKSPRAFIYGAFYLLCLVTSHFTKSPILNAVPSEADIAQVRNRHFQVLATLAVAGAIGGPAISMGWPRSSDQSILEVLTGIRHMTGTGKPRSEPGGEASKYAKDGGVDVIGWREAINGNPPPSDMYFGQTASGRNWRGKSAVGEIENFLWAYYEERPQTNHSGMTIIPFELSPEEHEQHGARHGHILDRLRAPYAAHRGYELAMLNRMPVDGVDGIRPLRRWVREYRLTGLAA